MLSWSITAIFIGNMLGGGYFTPLAQGVLVSFAVYLFFHRRGMSSLIVPAAMASAWIGNLVVLFAPRPWFIVRLSLGGYARMISVIAVAYFTHLAILMTMNAINRKAKELQAVLAEPTKTA